MCILTGTSEASLVLAPLDEFIVSPHICSQSVVLSLASIKVLVSIVSLRLYRSTSSSYSCNSVIKSFNYTPSPLTRLHAILASKHGGGWWGGGIHFLGTIFPNSPSHHHHHHRQLHLEQLINSVHFSGIIIRGAISFFHDFLSDLTNNIFMRETTCVVTIQLARHYNSCLEPFQRVYVKQD